MSNEALSDRSVVAIFKCWRRLGSACIQWSAVRFSAVSAALFGGVGTHGWRQLPASVVPVLDRALWIAWSSASLGRHAAWRRPRSCVQGLCRSGRVARCWRRCKSTALAVTCRFADEALPLLQQVRRGCPPLAPENTRGWDGTGMGSERRGRVADRRQDAGCRVVFNRR